MLELIGIHKSFNRGTVDEVQVLKGINLKINDGDFVTLVGNNGAGKTTLLNIIAGSLFPDEGKVLIDGVDVTNLPEYKRGRLIGRVFQDPLMGTAPSMTINENMALALKRGKRLGFKWALGGNTKAMIKDSLETLSLGLEERGRAGVGLLSGGQRQAITILMATMAEPKLLLLDEHTAALDPRAASLISELTERIVGETGVAAIMVTHNLSSALSMGNRLIMMEGGMIALDAKGDEKKRLTHEELLAMYV
ncbi:MAG: ATP-binding cassette domain-containing protein [Thermoanaerobacteraceae bacterium]|nr:ATP-binding cassette domain-containing protein [Thermoanaerobacteraceae bacterium]